jgi:hypothetical protein
MAQRVVSAKPQTKDIRELDFREVCDLKTWLTDYMRLETRQITNSKHLMRVLVRDTREYETDLGVFGVDE